MKFFSPRLASIVLLAFIVFDVALASKKQILSDDNQNMTAGGKKKYHRSISLKPLLTRRHSKRAIPQQVIDQPKSVVSDDEIALTSSQEAEIAFQERRKTFKVLKRKGNDMLVEMEGRQMWTSAMDDEMRSEVQNHLIASSLTGLGWQ